MSKSIKDAHNKPVAAIITSVIVILIALIIVGGLVIGGDEGEAYKNKSNLSFFSQDGPGMDYFHCGNCETILPCPIDRFGAAGRYPDCPSCGMGMNLRKNRPNMRGYGYGRNFNTVGSNSPGALQGSIGELICPDCSYTMPHQPGVPVYNVNCPRCNRAMTRQRPARVPTKYYQINSSNSNQPANVPAPPITTNAPLPHEYRGVCSNCHKIVYSSATLQ